MSGYLRQDGDFRTLFIAPYGERKVTLPRPTWETGERLAKIEGQMYTLVGNGQPGRISLLESAVNKLQQWRWYLLGAAGGVSGVVSIVARLIVEVGRK